MYVIKIYHIIIFYICLHNFLKTLLNIDYEKDVECNMYLINKTTNNKFYKKERRELAERECPHNIQNLQNPQNLRNTRKRIFDASLTLDELQQLRNIIIFERRILDDLINDIQQSIDDGKHIIFLKDFVKNKILSHLRLYRLYYSFNGINNMGDNLLNQMEEVISNFPLTHVSVNAMYISYKTELDISMDLLDCVLRQRDEQKRNEFLSNTNDIRLAISLRFNSEGIYIKKEIIEKMIKRIKQRIYHIILHHANLPSHMYRK
ncbi:Plasmodium exported protein, unknown function [Plasmodium sp. gorilla clade G2]|uniref:Plasmodium exported protein, unknown function n=1 Tax=Plasmodium sp. gorilla clade G2 TaxID=880535 RepID=UPI000D21CF66|nr:Plasmodium exported protein, unknown function [Plasmodium sp. gorilla clade G2]SOV18545.1 Plasmodium exported protein, unknown function [Plasmodium sp. gorilla clade G2]